MSQPAAALRRHQRHSARAPLELVRPGEPPRSPDLPPSTVARPGLRFQVEPFHAIARELPPLLVRHFAELPRKDLIPLDPDWDRMYGLAFHNNLIVMTIRDGPAMVGYILNLVGPHLLSKEMTHAEVHSYWLDPLYRGTWQTMRWFRANDDMLRNLGAKRTSVGVKIAGRTGAIFRRLGYEQIETIWTRAL